MQTAIAVACAAVQPACATPVAAMDLPKMISAANVIVAGRVAKLRSGVVSNWVVPVTLTVDVSRTIKGQVYPARTALTVHYVDRPSSNINVNLGDFRLFFLRCGSATNCTQATPSHLETLALPAGPATAGATGDATDRVREELLALVAADDRALAVLTDAVTDPPLDKAGMVRLEALRRLKSLPLAPIGDALKALAQAPAPGPRLAAIAALAKERDYSLLMRADAEMLHPTHETEQLVRAVADSLRGPGDRPSADVLPAAERWLQSRDAHVRQDAASVLRALGTAAAGTALARHGLDDPDRLVRYFSVGGLMAAFGDGGYPSTDLYDKDEHRYLDPWLRWREANRAGIEQGTCCERPKPPPEPVGRSVLLPGPQATR